jgi:hypothetical protein
VSHDPSRPDAERRDGDCADERGPTGPLTRLLTAFQGGEARAAADVLLRVADPKMTGKVGGAAHLAHLFTNPAWAPLLGHRSARVGGVERIGDAARARIEVEAADGARVAYLASLRRAPEAEADVAWRLTGLVREELADL